MYNAVKRFLQLSVFIVQRQLHAQRQCIVSQSLGIRYGSETDKSIDRSRRDFAALRKFAITCD